jgi:L-2-amino-thiazoline-4-carboxylic acid hydrolase
MNDRIGEGAEGEIGILARRRIEAAIVAPIYDEMRPAIGEEKARNRDGAFFEGFDRRIRLTRTQTIMGGASHCDFRYRSSTDPQT